MNNKILSLGLVIIIYLLIFIGIYQVHQYFIDLPLEINILISISFGAICLGIISCFSGSFHQCIPYWSLFLLVSTIYQATNLQAINFYHSLLLVILGIWLISQLVIWGWSFQGITNQSIIDRYFNKKQRKTNLILSFLVQIIIPLIIFYSLNLSVIAYLNPHSYPFSLSSILACGLMVYSILLMVMSNYQKSRYLKKHPGSVIINIGIWKKSRFPDLLATILFWFGQYLLLVSVFPSSLGRGEWAFFLPPLLILVVTVFIIIPIIERQSYREDPQYLNYLNQTNRLLPTKKLNGSPNK